MTDGANASFWCGRRVLLTGHTGFKGSWLTLWLHRLGAVVTGVSLPPPTTPSLFREADVSSLCDSHFCDIRDRAALAELIRSARPEIVFHLAAQSLVRASYQAPVETFASNLMGTVHVLDALRGLTDTRAVVMVTTDKVYRDNAVHRPYREDDALGGHDPYSASKAACEIVIASYRDAFLSAQGVAVASTRTGNVIGGGDWSDDRLIPDAIRAWQVDKELVVRQPQAIRPWQHVLEPLAGYLRLAHRLWQEPSLADCYNFGPDTGVAATVREVVELARLAYARGAVRYGEGGEGPHESHWLSLDTGKARERLGVEPVWMLVEAIRRTMMWYRAHGENADARQLCYADISSFESQMTDNRALSESAGAAA